MRRSKLWVAIVSLVLVLILAGCGKTVDDATANVYSGQAEEVIESLVEGEFQPIIEQFDEQMKLNVTEEALAKVTPLITAAGDYVGIKKSTVQYKDGFHVTVLVVEFSNKNHVLTVSYNDANQISGLFFQ